MRCHAGASASDRSRHRSADLGSSGDRLDYAQEAVKRYPAPLAAIDGPPIALNDPTTELADFPTWREQPGALGIRLKYRWRSQSRHGLRTRTADWFGRAAEKAGIPVMFLATGQTHQFARIAERHSQLVLIIDHMGVSSAGRSRNIGGAARAIDQRRVCARQRIRTLLREAVGGAALFVRATYRSARDPSFQSPELMLSCRRTLAIG